MKAEKQSASRLFCCVGNKVAYYCKRMKQKNADDAMNFVIF